MSIKRFNVDGFEGGLVPKADGAWVFYEDHAAELARVEGDRDAMYISLANVNNVCDTIAAQRDAAEEAVRVLSAEIRASRPVIERLEQHNALLRAECEAKQKKIDAAYDAFVHIAEYWNGSDNDRAVADALEVMRNEAADAAGALKGVE